MFKGGQPNAYDEIVNKTTDENLTSENWELILNLCDKVQDEGQEGAHNVIAAVLKRLAHRNPNVQLYALSLAEALSKNCTIELHRELASRAFTQGLEKIITDRTTHEKVRRRALGLIAEWTAEFQNDSTLGVMEDCYNNLKAKNFKFDAVQEAPPPAVDDEVRRREEEELQRVLEMSMQDKGGRNQWKQYSAASSSGAGGSGSSYSKSAEASASGSTSMHAVAASSTVDDHAPPSYSAGYVPARTPPPRQQTPVVVPAPEPTPVSLPAAATNPQTTAPVSESVAELAATGSITVVTRVRALHSFEPTEPGELAFEKGEIIKVVDRGYKDWWRGQLKGRTGIFPVNYVEPMPEPTAAELAKEAEKEASVFSQAANVDRLLSMLRSLDPAKDNLADNEEIQELYRSSMALRPKIVKLIDKYSQKRADLVSMNETFVRAKTIFDRMMEESLARHTGVYDSQPSYRASQYPASPDSRVRPEYSTASGPQAFGWNASSYEQPAYFPTPAAGYPAAPEGAYPVQPSQYVDPAAFAQLQQTQALYSQAYAQAAYGPQGPTPYPAQAQSQPIQPEPSATASLQPQPQTQPQAAQNPAQAVQQSTTAQQQTGPPYVYDPNGTYPDPNVQAWATYYAQGGKELAGAVYFISIPGLTDGTAQPNSPTNTAQQTQAAPVTQQQQQQPSSEAVGYSSQPSAMGAPQSNIPAVQTSLPLNGYGAGPTSPMAATSGPFPGPQASPPPTSPNQPTQMSSYHQRPTSGSPPSNPHAIPSSLQVSHEPPSHLPLPAANSYGDPGSTNTFAPPHNLDGNVGGGHEVATESNVSGYPQYYSLPTQFAGMTVGEDRNLGLHTGQQHTNQAAQGVGAPA